MRTQHARPFSRRSFLGGLTLAGTAGLFALGSRPVAAEPPPETTRIRLHKTAGVCYGPQYVAEELLHGEGFTDVQYVEIALADISKGIFQLLSSGAVDITTAFAPMCIIQVDTGAPIVLLGGVHVGCFELFGTERVRTIRDLKGKTVAAPEQGGGFNLFVASMAQYVGLNPHTDITWVQHPPAEAIP